MVNKIVYQQSYTLHIKDQWVFFFLCENNIGMPQASILSANQHACLINLTRGKIRLWSWCSEGLALFNTLKHLADVDNMTMIQSVFDLVWFVKDRFHCTQISSKSAQMTSHRSYKKKRISAQCTNSANTCVVQMLVQQNLTLYLGQLFKLGNAASLIIAICV